VYLFQTTLLTFFVLTRYGHAVGTDLCPLRPTIPQEGMSNRTITIATGKLLGGGSAVNGLVWVSLNTLFNKISILC
jgi:hypothetical protein